MLVPLTYSCSLAAEILLIGIDTVSPYCPAERDKPVLGGWSELKIGYGLAKYQIREAGQGILSGELDFGEIGWC